MSDLIILRLIPTQPTDPNEFRKALTKLTINVYDLSVDNRDDCISDVTKCSTTLPGTTTPVSTKIGSATDLIEPIGITVDPAHPNPFPLQSDDPTLHSFDVINTKPIIQHYRTEYQDDGSGTFQAVSRSLKSAATAVIKLEVPPGYREHGSFDIRLEIKRGDPSFDIIYDTLDYNVIGSAHDPLSNDQRDYFDSVYEADPSGTNKPDSPFQTSVYVPIPPEEVGLDPSVPYVALPADGRPPKFDSLLNAIDTVLRNHGRDILKDRPDPLDISESRHIADEIIWNRKLYPSPEPPKSLGEMYTSPIASPIDEDQQGDSNRKRFEAKLTAYHAVHDAEATRLAGYVFAVSAAIACERLTISSKTVAFTFPIITGPSSPPAGDKSVILTQDSSHTFPFEVPVPFVVPAIYFYALGASLPLKITDKQRYERAIHERELSLASQFQAAADDGTIVKAGSTPPLDWPQPVTIPPPKATPMPSQPTAAPTVNPQQAARRLHALGSTSVRLPSIRLVPPVFDTAGNWDYNHTDKMTNLVGHWLYYAIGPIESVNEDFWVNETNTVAPKAYLELILNILVGGDPPPRDNLIRAIKQTRFLDPDSPSNATFRVNTIQHLVKINDKEWRDFFLAKFPPADYPTWQRGPPGEPPRLSLIPTNILPGRPPALRVEAFIANLRTFFTVPVGKTEIPKVSLNKAPTLEYRKPDIFEKFAESYVQESHVAAFKFGSGWQTNTAAVAAALGSVFPNDPYARAWLISSLQTIDALYTITDIGQPDIRFSLMEALFARGFTNKESIKRMTKPEFKAALTGTIAYKHAYDIHGDDNGDGGQVNGGSFKPVNPDGSLTNCIPPLHLSPLGPIEYLHELLRASQFSTCRNPMPNIVINDSVSNFGESIAKRRGSIESLHVTRANMQIQLPLIDLVNESLEALTAGLTSVNGGAVYDTAINELAGHKIRSTEEQYKTSCCSNSRGPYLHDPLLLFAAVPQYSSPATPVAKPGAYDSLKIDFTSPFLPYSQPLDISRSYLGQFCTSRYELMRRFRKKISEFVLDPVAEPADFQNHLWRYPNCIEIAIEFLCLSPEEYKLLFTNDIVVTPSEEGRPKDALLLRELYGFESDTIDDEHWTQIVVRVSEFIKRTGLTYCQFFELWRSEFVRFRPEGEQLKEGFPACPPCCLDNLIIQFMDPEDANEALKRLAVFIRLWRKLQEVGCMAEYTFSHLRDLCDILHLFLPNGSINPDFIRQLASFQILREVWGLALVDETDLLQNVTGADRTHILALWSRGATGTKPRKLSWAIDELLHKIEVRAETKYCRAPRQPDLIKIFRDNLDRLSELGGFDPNVSSYTWHTLPTHTLRFVEILTKIYASDFSVGEILFLFTTDTHLSGDDPFPISDENEAQDSPLDLPDDDDKYSLWELRRKLLDVRISENELDQWTWPRIESSLKYEFGHTTAQGESDTFQSLGEHFFPHILEQYSGTAVEQSRRQYRIDLAHAHALMWNTPPKGPFRYDSAAQQLWTELPLRDNEVIEKLSHIRQLRQEGQSYLPPDEEDAVRELYFLPRCDLAPIAFIFTDFSEAEKYLIEEPDENTRWAYFQREFAKFHARCCVIVEHLAAHVGAVRREKSNDDNRILAWRLLRHLLADENQSVGTTWEVDSGEIPSVTWGPQPNGGAFAALHGLVGTGLLGEFTAYGNGLVWREVRAPMTVFSRDRNDWNCPVPTILPSMDFTLSPDVERFAVLRNGFALRATDGVSLGGAQGFVVRWSGAIIIEKGGVYEFWAGAPTPDDNEPDFEGAQHRDWRVSLKRGQKIWILVSHHWEGGSEQEVPAFKSLPHALKRGAYEIVVEFRQPHPTFSRAQDACPQHTGFQVKYCGPDSQGRIVTIPGDKLFRASKNGTLAEGQETGIGGAPKRFLEQYYTSSLRDIRRTYQRVFKALLFAHRFCLSAKLIRGDIQSEIGYFLDHEDEFLGTSYYWLPENGGFSTHHAFFNFNLLPIYDPYLVPSPDKDIRVKPSMKRRQALFDWWERIFDYSRMREETERALEPPSWLLFYEAAEKQPDDPAQILRHLGVDIRHAKLVLNYFQAYSITSPDLEDERWAIRVWECEKWIRNMLCHFLPKDISQAQPDLWASDAPDLGLVDEPISGNQNLTKFFRDGCIENGDPRRYEVIRRLNDGLRQRAREALLSYLCGMRRVVLPWGVGNYAQKPDDLSDLLLQDVKTGICEKVSRIEEAINAVQTLVSRARLGLEPDFEVLPEFVQVWDQHFASFHIWQACKRREIYPENWIEWEELEQARKTEAFRFLESHLRRSTLTLAVPGGMEWWPVRQTPAIAYQSLVTLQSREISTIQGLDGNKEGFGLLGVPERDARLSWLAPVTDDDTSSIGSHSATRPQSQSVESLPLWIQAAIRLGTRFIRIAASGIPPASTTFVPRNSIQDLRCCVECGHKYPATIDEYYFWLQDSRYYQAVEQNADFGIKSSNDPKFDTNSAWRDTDQHPSLLHWDSAPMVHLFWCRIHNGQFQQPRRSDRGLAIDEKVRPELEFAGRTADSLQFKVVGGQTLPGNAPEGTTNDNSNGNNSSNNDIDTSPPGFRYDLANDSAVVLPLVAKGSFENGYPGDLKAYPFFAFFEPGSTLEPPSLFSVAHITAAALRTHCRFEAALEWYKLVLNPVQWDNRWAQCPVGNEDNDDNGDGAGVRTDTTNNSEPCCPTSPVDDNSTDKGGTDIDWAQVTKERAILLAYLETLLQWGDAQMCRDIPEAFRQASIIFSTIERILGKAPTTVYTQYDEANAMTVGSFVPYPAPLNPRLMALYERVSDRLLLVHHCLNGNRLRTRWPSEEMQWSNRLSVSDWKTFTSSCEDEDEWCITCCSPYRFAYRLQKAIELASEAGRKAAELLAAYEKGDAEYLASLRIAHERQLQQLTLDVRQNQWREADWQVQALGKTKYGAETRRDYFRTLKDNGLNAGETNHVALSDMAIQSHSAATNSQESAKGVILIPDISAGVAGLGPYLSASLPIGAKLGQWHSTTAAVQGTQAAVASVGAAISLTQSGWDRREADWEQQVKVISIEIDQIERQMNAAERVRDRAMHELNNQQQMIEHSLEIHNFVRDKFTAHDIYLYLQQETAALYYRWYMLAHYAARQAQILFNYEHGYTTNVFIPEQPWNGLREGLMSSDRLLLALRVMENAHINSNCREYELTKHISLRLNFPVQFLQLQATGSCEIDLPEWLFDLDYPGHYMRRIRSVSLTIPCVVGPYTGVHCRLTLLSSTTRIDPCLINPPASCCDPDACFCGHCKAENRYKALTDDPRIVIQYATTEAIATSSGQNDSGMFELSFRDERYLPFEFAGAVSRWRIELPQENNQFDMDTLSDVILHLNYAAREGGEVLRRAANEIAQKYLPGNGIRFFDLKHELPEAWHQFQQSYSDHTPGREKLLPPQFCLRLTRTMFPFIPPGRCNGLRIPRMEIFFEAKEAQPSAHRDVEFLIGHRIGHHTNEYSCNCEIRNIECVASAEWPETYHGVLEDVSLGPLSDNSYRELGTFRFPTEIGKVSRIFLFCAYNCDVK